MKCVTNLIIAKKRSDLYPQLLGGDLQASGRSCLSQIPYLFGVFEHWTVNSMIYDERFGTCRISFNLDSNKKLNFLVQILGKGWRLTVTQAVHDGVPIKTLDTRDSGEIPIGDIPFGTLLDSAICISFFCWF